MKAISYKRGSSREWVDAEAILLPVPNWRYTDEGRRLVLYSQWNTSERSTELWLTEEEAFGIAKMVSQTVLDEAINAITAPKKE